MLQHVKCRSIGTSKGVIIPNNLLKLAQIHLNDELDIEYSQENQTIVIKKAVNVPRLGWGEAFKQLHASGGDELLINDVFEDEFNDESI